MNARKRTTKPIAGHATSNTAAASSATIRVPARTYVAVATVAVREIVAVRMIDAADHSPSATQMIPATIAMPTRELSTAAPVMPAHVARECRSPEMPTTSRNAMARLDESTKDARLKRSFVGHCRRFTASASPAPRSCARISWCGGRNSSPGTSASSLSEIECVSLRKCT